MQTSTTRSPLEDYVNASDLLALKQIAVLFPSDNSLEWFIRRNRQRLVDADALIVVAGRLKFHVSRFEAAVVDIGRDAAKQVAR